MEFHVGFGWVKTMIGEELPGGKLGELPECMIVTGLRKILIPIKLDTRVGYALCELIASIQKRSALFPEVYLVHFGDIER